MNSVDVKRIGELKKNGLPCIVVQIVENVGFWVCCIKTTKDETKRSNTIEHTTIFVGFNVIQFVFSLLCFMIFCKQMY